MENIENVTRIVEQHEKLLSWKRGGGIDERVDHCLSQYRQIADNAIHQAKNFLEDSKTQYKALEIILEGLTSDGLNHGQKRVIANHVITMLRSMVDRLSQVEYNYTSSMLDRYNFFRSETPEKRLHEERRELKQKVEQQNGLLEKLKSEHPEVYEKIAPKDNIPF